MRPSCVTLAFIALFVLGGPAAADDYEIGDLGIDHPWSRATSARNGAAYLTLVNEGQEMDRLVGAASPLARKAALHMHLVENNVVKMRPAEAVEVHPGESIPLRPGGLHIMLIGLKGPLETGGRFPLILTFETAGSVEVEVEVLEPGSMGPEGTTGAACSVCAARHARHATTGPKGHDQPSVPTD